MQDNDAVTGESDGNYEPETVLRMWCSHPAGVDGVEVRIVRYTREGWGPWQGEYLNDKGEWHPFKGYDVLPTTIHVNGLHLHNVKGTLNFDELQAVAEQLTERVTALWNEGIKQEVEGR